MPQNWPPGDISWTLQQTVRGPSEICGLSVLWGPSSLKAKLSLEALCPSPGMQWQWTPSSGPFSRSAPLSDPQPRLPASLPSAGSLLADFTPCHIPGCERDLFQGPREMT